MSVAEQYSGFIVQRSKRLLSPPCRQTVPHLYRQLLLDIGKYLDEMEIPHRFIEVMTDTSSNDIRWLTRDQAISMSGVPSIVEWIAATCGAKQFTVGVDILAQISKDMLTPGGRGECELKKIHNARDAIVDIN
jgi:hypothetical protein